MSILIFPLYSRLPIRTCLKLKAGLLRYQMKALHSYNKDIVLYTFSRPTFFRVIGIACASQFFFWSYLGHFVYTELRSTWNVFPANVQRDASFSPDTPREKSLASWKLRAGLASLSVGAGTALAVTGFLYASRSISRLVLLKHNGGLCVTTYTPIGTQRPFTTALKNVQVIGSRAEKRHQMPIKIAGRRFYFLLDMQGVFHQPTIFDRTIGITRNWRA